MARILKTFIFEIDLHPYRTIEVQLYLCEKEVSHYSQNSIYLPLVFLRVKENPTDCCLVLLPTLLIR